MGLDGQEPRPPLALDSCATWTRSLTFKGLKHSSTNTVDCLAAEGMWEPSSCRDGWMGESYFVLWMAKAT